MHENQKEKSTDHEELLKTALERFKFAEEAESEIRQLAKEDLEFSIGEQWDPEIRRVRDEDGRPCLTINRLNPSIRQVTNDIRQNRPAIKVSPVDDKGDVETAEIQQGMIRHIEYSSNASVAYHTAGDSAVRCGFGYFRIVTEYCDPWSFDQDIKIKAIKDRFSVYLDPNYQEPDGSDANWGFVFEDLTEDAFKSQYPNAKLAQMEDWGSLGSRFPGWTKEKSVRVAEYFYKEFKEVDLVLVALENPKTGKMQKQVFEKSKLKDALAEINYQILAERKSLVPTIKWCKIAGGVDVLEETEWPGKWIPIVPVLGEELVIDGKRVLYGMVRDAKDPARMYNYWASSETESIALAPRSPWIGYEGQFEGFENEWATANVRNHAFLQVKPLTIGGQPAPFPVRNTFEPAVQAISQARMLASDDLKATTGIYDAALGNRSNEQSGIAIQRRASQAQTSNFHFMDNLSISIRHCGRILLDLIPHIYDTERAVRILGEDGTEEVIRLNEPNEDGKTYDLSVGKYDVTVDTGPSFQTKRQEAAASMIDFTKAMPDQAKVIVDLIAKNLDWPGAQEIAERFRKTLPPEITGEDGNGQEVPPQVQFQIQEMSQAIEALTQKLNEANDKLQNKTIELESKERIEFAKMQLQAELEMAKLGSQESIVLLKEELAQIRSRLDNELRFNQAIEEQDQNENQDFNPDVAVPTEPEAASGFDQPFPAGGDAPENYMEQP